LARTNFSFKKRQKEIERQKKQEEKRQRRMAKKNDALEDPSADRPDDNTSGPGPETDQDPDLTP